MGRFVCVCVCAPEQILCMLLTGFSITPTRLGFEVEASVGLGLAI